METFPQIQTIIDEYSPPISTIIDAPWVNVTSVNGMTGDVLVEIKLGDFEPNHFYQKNTAIIYNGSLYYAKEDFTSSEYFRLSDWNYPSFTQEQANWTETNTSANAYIKNKPTKLSQFTNDLNLISEDDVNSIVTTRIEPLEESVEGLDARITTNTGSISTLGTKISGVETNLDTLSTNVTNMKTDGSVTKLGNNTVGGADTPIYLNSGTPTVCTTGEWGGVVTTNSIGGTSLGEAVYLTDRNGFTRGSIAASTSGLTLSSPAYLGSVSTSNRILTASDLNSSSGEWILIGSNTASSDTTGQFYASVPSSYRGYPWEYKVVFGYEVTKTSSGTVIVTMTMDGTAAPYDSCFVGVRQGTQLNYTSSSDATFFGHEWYIFNSNESCAGEVLVSRAGSGNFWNGIGKAGGMSSGPCALTVGSRTIGSNNITYFNLNFSTTSGSTWLAGTHIEIYARRYF